jgi:1-acyl-sn-glycerol-3-phosphate acyltransferase
MKPTAKALRRLTWFNRLAGPLARSALKPWLQHVEMVGSEHLQKGPLLVLMNHATAFDPLLLTLYARRPIHFLVTEPAMFAGLRGKALAWMGQVPKRKLEADTRSIRTLKAWCAQGGVVGVFPEGVFPWDGKLGPLQPGLGLLVHHLDVPVVTVRQINGDRLWPAWAKRARRTSVRLEVDAPLHFKPGDAVEKIVAERLFVDTDQCSRWPVEGRDLAQGLSEFLRLCPQCGADGTLTSPASDLLCQACGGRWRVGTDNRLKAADHTLDIGQALDQVLVHLQKSWGSEKTFKSRSPVEVFDASAAAWTQLASGRLALSGHELHVDNEWQMDLSGVLATTLDWGHHLLLRTRRQRIAICMPQESRALWHFAIEQARSEPNQPSTNIAGGETCA